MPRFCLYMLFDHPYIRLSNRVYFDIFFLQKMSVIICPSVPVLLIFNNLRINSQLNLSVVHPALPSFLVRYYFGLSAMIYGSIEMVSSIESV